MKRLAALTVGLTPEKAALLIAVGFVLGTFPVLGVATLLCAGAALALRLNVAALVIVGQIVTPAQYALLLPLAGIGARVTGFHAGIGGPVAQMLAGWLCVCVPLGVTLYITLLVAMRCGAAAGAHQAAARG